MGVAVSGPVCLSFNPQRRVEYRTLCSERALRFFLAAVVAGVLLVGVAASANAQQLVVQIAANRSSISRGDTLTIGVTRQNPGLAGTLVDFYAGALLPDGHTLLLFTPSGVVVGSTSSLAAVHPLESAVNLSIPGTVSSQLLSVQFVDFMPPPGTYLFFYLALTINALADGILEPNEIVAVATTSVRFDTLRSVAAGVGLKIGAAVQPQYIAQDLFYGPALTTDFSEITPENQMKFGPLRPTPTTFDFESADTLVDFAVGNGMAVHGHTLVWHMQLPTWLTSGSWTRDQLIDILRTHIQTVVGRYKRKVAAWDVVNEAVDATGQLRSTIWQTIIGDDYIEMAFRWANEADPDAKLFYNDFGAEGLGTKSDAVYSLVRNLLMKGTPIHGVGLQMHVSQDFAPTPQNVVTNMQRLAALGLQIHISEMDVRLLVPPSPQTLALQAQVYANMMHACLTVTACTKFSTWGFTDKHSWIPSFFPGFGAALMFDADYHPKLAYHALLATLRGEQVSVSADVPDENPSAGPGDGPSGTRRLGPRRSHWDVWLSDSLRRIDGRTR